MLCFLIFLVASVFIGTELLAIPTPFLQITLYRMLNLASIGLFVYQLWQDHSSLKWTHKGTASFVIYSYLFWLLWAIISVAWALDFKHWFQNTFLLALGVIVILALFFWVRDLFTWRILIQTTWVMIFLLAIWGMFELISNHYIFADMAKLDKYNTFASQPLTRIPITHFENQNDYATMLLASLPLGMILFNWSRSWWMKSYYVGSLLLISYLIYRSGSRMSLLSLVVFFIVFILLQFDWDLDKKIFFKLLIGAAIIGIAVLAFIPPLRHKLFSLVYTGGNALLTGDVVRLNLWRNGLHFLATTLGLGVGAGNIEVWMKHFDLLPLNGITNMHNWWLEILVAYGIPTFILYVLAYVMMVRKLWLSRRSLPANLRLVNNSLISFLVIYIAASITSANNMLIEWHWVFFGLIITYIKLIETTFPQHLTIEKIGLEDHYEYHHLI
ncbi:O-antigen ligase family protein [Hutsoniella sourekii]